MTQDSSNLHMGSGSNLGQGISGPSGDFGIQPVSQPDQPPPSGQPTKDTIEKAAALVASLYLPPMSNPMLTPPDPDLAISIGQMEMDKICLSILDSWSKNLEEIAEAKKEQERRDEINPIIREMHISAGIILSVATIFIRAIFGTQAAEAFQSTGGITDEKSIANRFATQLNQWALDGTLDGYLKTIVDKLPSAEKMTEAEKIILIKQLQVMLLSSALAGLYKTQTQWITAEEFIYLLSHPNMLNDPNSAMLAVLIVNGLSELPEPARMRMAKTLSIYMNTNPDLPTLFNLSESAEVQMSILNSSRS